MIFGEHRDNMDTYDLAGNDSSCGDIPLIIFKSFFDFYLYNFPWFHRFLGMMRTPWLGTWLLYGLFLVVRDLLPVNALWTREGTNSHNYG